MSLPKGGKVAVKGPQSIAGFPMPKLSTTGAGSKPATIKTVVQSGTKASQTKDVGVRASYAAARKPSTSGTKITKVIQTGTKASKR